ncbi:hypothetical protein PROFUN_15988 [Planoprotostelium fungivorum]|uniref:Uncharacterized protein n=1 Tax=Planoprotostelium fungivorum TaxID=1890364 RepID=A0A2P6MTD1_9EUKA|nr:hypothetical protein PROFUN_15988 [Planoprotostelium fungivorum]
MTQWWSSAYNDIVSQLPQSIVDCLKLRIQNTKIRGKKCELNEESDNLKGLFEKELASYNNKKQCMKMNNKRYERLHDLIEEKEKEYKAEMKRKTNDCNPSVQQQTTEQRPEEKPDLLNMEQKLKQDEITTVANPASPDTLAERIWRRETNVLSSAGRESLFLCFRHEIVMRALCHNYNSRDNAKLFTTQSYLCSTARNKQRKRDFIDLSEEMFIFNRYTTTHKHLSMYNGGQQAANKVVHCNNNKSDCPNTKNFHKAAAKGK